ncbi:MAG: fibronectin type III domain-containing protein [Methanomassiliicoccales archaeon]|nr:fibronectin type III domain-containing protein [Methanomassiliicoccales archaeon]
MKKGIAVVLVIASVLLIMMSCLSSDAIAAQVPSAPLSLTATPGSAQITLGWLPPLHDNGSPVVNYTIYRSTTPGTETFLVKVGIASTSYTDPGLTNGQAYYYKVTATNAIGESPLSNEASATPAAPPSAPRSLTASSGDAQVSLSWTAPSSNGGSPITNYSIYRSLTSGSEVFLKKISNLLAYTDTGLTNGQIYFYLVTASNNASEGAVSNEASAIPATVPSAPQGLAATTANTQITLTWMAPSSDGGSAITNYSVYRGTSSGGETPLITIGNLLTYTDTGLTIGQDYYYKVSAVNSIGESPLSNEASATPSTVPTAPRDLTAVVGDAHVDLNWTAPLYAGPGTLTYHLFRDGALIWSGTSLSFSDASISNGITYSYKAAAQNDNGWGPNSTAVQVTTHNAPTAPRNLVAVAGAASALLNWTAPSNDGGSAITGYIIYRGTSPGGETFLTLVGNVLAFADSGLTNGQIYYYRVSAVNGVGEGSMSNEASVTPITIPSAPQNLVATPSNGENILTWTAPSTDGGSPITSYKVYRGTVSGGEALTATLGNVLSYADVGLTNGQTYYYLISAVNIVGEGALSNEASATPGAVPSAPTLISATSGDEEVELTWSAPSSDGGSAITGYNLYRGESSGGEALLASLGDVLTYVDEDLQAEVTYFYMVSAVNIVGEGTLSNELSATPVGVPSAPQDPQATAGDGFINLTWSAPANDGGSAILSYQIWRGLASGAESFYANASLNFWFNDTGLSNGQTYYYMIGAVNAVGEGPMSNETYAAPGTLPTAPQLISAIPANGQVWINWTAPSDDGGSPITNYSIYRSTTHGTGTLLTMVGNVLNYTDTGLTNSQIYYYTVAAVNAFGEGQPSNELSAIPMAIPSAPLGLMASWGDARITLTWSAPASDGGSTIINYTIYRSTASGAESYLAIIGNTLSYDDLGLTNGQIYYYVVTAVNGAGEGPKSNETSAVPMAPPSAPLGLTATSGDSLVSLAWSSPSSDGGGQITGFKIYRGTAPGAESLLMTLGDVLDYIDTGLVNGQAYYYQVSAVNAAGEGPRSSEISSTPAAVPTAPRGLTATPGNLAIGLSWTPPLYCGPGSITYQLFRDGALIWTGTTTDHVDSPLVRDRQHSYQVSAKNSIGRGPNCTAVLAAADSVPDAPWGIQAVSGNAQIALSWSAVNYTGPGVLKYHLFRDGRCVWNGTATSYLGLALVNGRTYEFKVAASNDLGWSSNSTSIDASPEGPPTAPLSFHAEPGICCVRVSWAAPSYVGPGTTRYFLFRDGVLIWNGTELEHVDSEVDTNAHSYSVAAINSLGMGVSTSSVVATPLPEEESSTPLALIAIASLVIIGLIPLLILIRQRSKKKEPAASVQQMNCPRCGTSQPGDSEACSNCGLRLSR